MQASLGEFQQFYNLQRPNQALSCGNQPPSIVFPNLPTLPALPEKVDPDRWLLSYHGRVFERRVNANGRVTIDHYPYYIGRAYAGQRVAFHLDARQSHFRVQLNGKIIATFAIAMVTEIYFDRSLGGMLFGFFIPFLLCYKPAKS